MRLIIVRHGKADQDSPDGTDFSRPLRKRGIRQAEYLGDRLRRSEPPVARVIASRAERARHTGSILAEAVGVPLEHDDALLVDEPLAPVLERLPGWAESLPTGAGALILVGHNPQLERLAAVLVGGPTAPARPLRTGEAVALDIDAESPIGGVEVERLRLEEP